VGAGKSLNGRGKKFGRGKVKKESKAQFRRRASAVPKVRFGKQLSSTSSAVLHDYGTAAIQTSCFCRAKLNS